MDKPSEAVTADGLEQAMMEAIIGDDPVEYNENGRRKRDKLHAVITKLVDEAELRGYQAGKIVEAKICAEARRHG